MAGLNTTAANFVHSLLAAAHRTSRETPIRGADGDGVFPPMAGFDLLGLRTRTPPVIPDTNVLRRDIGRVCRRRERTVLLNAANSGAIRLLCPIHVVNEMFEHAQRFSDQIGIDVAEYLTVWRRDYLSLMRVIDDLPDGLLTSDEETRVDTLATVDPDDVPAVRLVLATGGFFLSDDRPALTAVYGSAVDFGRHTKWVGALMAGGDAHELGNALETGALLSRIVGGVALSAGRRVASSGAIAGLSLGAALIAYAHATPNRRAKARAAAGMAGAVILQTFVSYLEASGEICSLAAPAPAAVHIALTSDRARLTRACLLAFGQTAHSTHTARSLREHLPTNLGVPSGEAKVRSVLREYGCFFEPYAGHFQLGRPLSR
jgi:predicted nucleic acid-binding protein